MRVIITGDRAWECDALMRHILGRLIVRYGSDLVIIHGAAPGVDASAGRVAAELGLDVEAFPADWRRHGRRAGPLRNAQMIASGADLVVAVHRDLAASKGTKDCCCQAIAAGIDVYLVDDDGGRVVRVK